MQLLLALCAVLCEGLACCSKLGLTALRSRGKAPNRSMSLLRSGQNHAALPPLGPAYLLNKEIADGGVEGNDAD
jgi:hypothetical protein